MFYEYNLKDTALIDLLLQNNSHRIKIKPNKTRKNISIDKTKEKNGNIILKRTHGFEIMLKTLAFFFSADYINREEYEQFISEMYMKAIDSSFNARDISSYKSNILQNYNKAVEKYNTWIKSNAEKEDNECIDYLISELDPDDDSEKEKARTFYTGKSIGFTRGASASSFLLILSLLGFVAGTQDGALK